MFVVYIDKTNQTITMKRLIPSPHDSLQIRCNRMKFPDYEPVETEITLTAEQWDNYQKNDDFKESWTTNKELFLKEL